MDVFWITLLATTIATLVAGFILSVPVAIGVARLLQRQEHEREATRLTDSARRQRAMLLEELQFIFIQPPQPYLTTALAEGGRYPAEIEHLVQRFDIPTMRALLNDSRVLFDGIAELRRRWALFKAIAEIIDVVYVNLVRESLTGSAASDARIRRMATFCIMVGAGGDADEIRRLLGVRREDVPLYDDVRRKVDLILRERLNADDLIATYGERLEALHQELRRLLDTVRMDRSITDLNLRDDLRQTARVLTARLHLSPPALQGGGEAPEPIIETEADLPADDDAESDTQSQTKRRRDQQRQ